MNLAKTLLNFFRSREDTYAQQKSDGSYTRIDAHLKLEDIQSHLRGEKTVGIYVISDAYSNKCHFCAIDLDTLDKHILRKLTSAIIKEGFGNNALLEFSGNKGYHIFFKCKQPMPAKLLRQFLLVFLKKADISLATERFPKQDSISVNGFGSLIKLPLGLHQKSEKWSNFLDLKLEKPLAANHILNIENLEKEAIEAFVRQNKKLIAPKILPERRSVIAMTGTPPCITQILAGVNEGCRDVALFNLCVYYLKMNRLSASNALDKVLAWNRGNTPVLSTSYVQWKLNYINSSKYGKIACRMDEMQEFCKEGCQRKKEL